MRKSFDPTDALAGIVFIAFGLFFGLSSLLRLDIGTAFRMGPGYAPLVLASVLLLLGVLILLSALRTAPEPVTALAWRGMLFLLPAPILFGLTVRGLGFVPAIFLATLLAAFASPRMRPWQAVVLALAVTVFSTLVFSYALGLPFRRFGPWLPV
ncbi:tripartite tricarboxylate transporter TctB family protein [Rubellimicrobium arenae]|uniref:tripartite tricarboxylate transporter TctB family protein n=1 Tax=Rubellimicrobium arenae TaxID=2817372 RepID=UPI001B30DD35|nr:tripartite tricarboxylate transporter TctB family protein [Rubellimicrobium arenae]